MIIRAVPKLPAATRAARTLSAASAPAAEPKDTVEHAHSQEPGLFKRVATTSIGLGTMGGAGGFVVDLIRGQGFTGPTVMAQGFGGGSAWVTGVTAGLAIGAAVGVASYFIARHAHAQA